MAGILREGRNCCCITNASCVAFLIDGERYFRAFSDAVAAADETILITGWDIDSRTPLAGGHSAPLWAFLDDQIRRKPALEAYLLSWDFSWLFALEREPFPAFKLGWRTHRRLHFRLDGRHPIGGSHHQKIIVVDDALAITGGLDLTIQRYDTRAHDAHDARRVGPTGKPYGPFHDVGIAVAGAAAERLGDLVRTRWQRVTGVLPPAPARRLPPWPAGLPPVLRDVSVAISRTEGAYGERPAVTEIRELYIDALDAARDCVYIENQYLTALAISDALAALLQRPHPPEVVIVLPRTVKGWLQWRTMGVMRARLIARLRASDHAQRLHFYWPTRAGLTDDVIRVHSKVLIVDEAFVTVGSANLNNRSMGLDSECNVSLEASGDARVARAIDHLRCDLLGEHLGLTAEEVRARRAHTDSWAALIAACRSHDRHLEPLADEEQALPTEPLFADPERPIEAQALIAAYMPETAQPHVTRHLVRNALILLAVLACASLWHITPLHTWLKIGHLIALLHAAGRSSSAPLWLEAGFVVGGLVFFPVTVLVLLTAIAFTAPFNIGYAFLGCLLSASVNYGLGRAFGTHILERLAQGRWHGLRQRLQRRGLGTMVAVNLIPIAPFTLVTLTAGALRIRYRDVLLGTAIGVAPGILTLTVFARGLTETLTKPGTVPLALLGLLALMGLALALRLHHRTTHRGRPETHHLRR